MDLFMSEVAFLSIGSNLGDRDANIASAISALGTLPEILSITSASFYETDPLYNLDQPKFLNTVVKIETELSPFELFDKTVNIEKMMGRPEKREKNQSRSLDIDILCYGNSYLETESLTIPHPGIPERKFVLVPFAELAPGFILPVWNLSVKAMLNLCPDQSVVRKHKIETSA